MAIANYTDLKQAVKDWANRQDLDAYLANLISVAETRIKNLTDNRQTEVEATLSTSVGLEYVSLPDGFGSPIALWLADLDPREKLNQILAIDIEGSDTNGRPQYWAIDGSTIKFDVPCDAIYPIDFRFLKVFDLSDSSPTNSILTNYPNVYLYASLVEVCAFTKDMDAGTIYESKFQQAVAEMKERESKTKRPISLRTEFGSIPFNIETGR